MIIDIPLADASTTGPRFNAAQAMLQAATNIGVLLSHDDFGRTVRSPKNGQVIRFEGIRLSPDRAADGDSYRAFSRPYGDIAARRKNAICFHGHREWMRGFFAHYPNAIIKSSLAEWRGKDHFEAEFDDKDGQRNETCQCIGAHVDGSYDLYSEEHLRSLGIRV